MKGVIGKVIENEAQGPRPPRKRDVDQSILVNGKGEAKQQTGGQQSSHGTAKTEQKRRQRVHRFVTRTVTTASDQHFDEDQRDKARNRIINRVGKLGHRTCRNPAAQTAA